MNDLELEITSKAYNDIEIISDYIAKDNKTAATKFVRLYVNILILGNQEMILHI